jgi:hypothetical protein
MSIEPIIARLIGRAEQGDATPRPVSPEEGRELSRRLRDLVNADAGGGAPDQGSAEEALKLAAYLDGTMGADERAAFERDLVHSPQRREELISAAAWLDEIEAKRQLPPASIAARALALDVARPRAATEGWWVRFVRSLDATFSGRRLAVATTALASVAIVAVGLDIALHTNPALFGTPESGTTPQLQAGAPNWPDRVALEPRARMPSEETRPPRFALPMRASEINSNAELIDAVIAYHDDPSQRNRQQLLAALARGGLPAQEAGLVQTIEVQKRLRDRFGSAGGRRVLTVAISLVSDGTLTLDLGRVQPD